LTVEQIIDGTEVFADGRLQLQPATDTSYVLLVDGTLTTVSVDVESDGGWRAYDGTRLVSEGSPGQVKQDLVAEYVPL